MNAAKLAVTTNSWFAGTNPNTTAPTDRPATSNVLYVGTDASLWIWNGTLYISLIGAKVPTATTRTFTTSTGASGFQFLQQTELLYIILYQYLLQLEWEVHLQELLI